MRLGISHASVSNWMRGITEPSNANVEKLARLTGEPASEIYRLLGRIEPIQADDPEQQVRDERLLQVFRELREEHQDTILMVATTLLEQQRKTEGE